MIKEIFIDNFKGFKSFTINLETISLLVGANNSGKTTIFHALQTFFWCIERTAFVHNGIVKFGKTQIPEITAFPYLNTRDIFYHQKIRDGKTPRRIRIRCEFDGGIKIGFDIYSAFSRNLMIDGHNFTMSEDSFSVLLNSNKPIFIPSTIGITAKEELYRLISQERLISEGRHNEVIRNQIYRLQKNSDSWIEFVELLNQIFEINGIDIPFNENKDEWLSVIYTEEDYSLDCISAGSGFLQLLNILVFIYLNDSKVALLDEPDSHMHTDLQTIFFESLQKISQSKSIQLLIATHSSTLIDSAGLENIFVIDKKENFPLKADNTNDLISALSNQGIFLPHTKIIDILNSPRVIFLEDEKNDYENFIKAFGKQIISGFSVKTKNIIPISTGGSSKTNFQDAIRIFENLIGVNIQYVYLIDRDFRTDNQLIEYRNKFTGHHNYVHILERRNRESYLCEPKIISRLLKKKWEIKNPDQEMPNMLTENSILVFFINQAQTMSVDTQSSLITQQEPNLRGDSRKEKTLEINTYFDENYTKIIGETKIPYKLFDSKSSLALLRKNMADNFKLSFSDLDLIAEFTSDEVSDEIKIIIEEILKM